MHAAEDDVLGIGLRGHHGKLVGIALKIGVADNIITLIMMAENDNIPAECLAGRLDAFGNFSTSASGITRKSSSGRTCSTAVLIIASQKCVEKRHLHSKFDDVTCRAIAQATPVW